jgi:hypothetical protein
MQQNHLSSALSWNNTSNPVHCRGTTPVIPYMFMYQHQLSSTLTCNNPVIQYTVMQQQVIQENVMKKTSYPVHCHETTPVIQ